MDGIWTPSTLLQRTIDHSAFFLMPGCQCCGGLLVLCHGKGETPKGTGTISRLNPHDGSVIWTVDLGIDPVTERPRVGYRPTIDSVGNIYVVWMVSSDADGISGPGLPDNIGPAGGVVKLSSDGAQLAFIEFPLINTEFAGAGSLPPRIVIHPDQDDQIYATCDWDEDDNWLYKLNANLEIQWGSSLREGAISNRGVALAIDSISGDVYASNDVNNKVYRIDPSGSLVGTITTAVVPRCLIVDPVRGVRVTGPIAGPNPVNPIMWAYDNSLTIDWQVSLDEFDVFPPGSWAASPAVQFGAGVYIGGAIFFGATVNSPQWEVAAGGDRFASLFLVSTFGSPLPFGLATAAGWGSDWTSGENSLVYDLAHNAATNETFIAGGAFDGTLRIAGKLGGWEAKVFIAEHVTIPPLGWGIAVR